MKANRLERQTAILAVSLGALILAGGCSPETDPAGGSSGENASNEQTGDPVEDDTGDDTQAALADTVYTNGKIYTVNEKQPWAEAIAIKDGKFIKVGSVDDVKPLIGDKTEVIDLGGKFVMPGMVDAHVHMLATSVDKANLFIENPNDKEAMLKQIEEFAKANPDLPYIRGLQWNLGVFPDNSPRKEWLDAIVPDRPVYIYSQTGHEAWVNSKTVELIKLKGREQDNQYIWDVDAKTGQPSGTIKEYTMSLVEQALDPTPPERLAPKLAELVQVFNTAGFTAVKEAGAEIWTVRAANLLDREGKLNIRVFAAWFHRGHIGAMTPEKSRAVAAEWKKYESPMVYPRYVKMYADGASNSRSALLLDDYEGEPGFRGAMSFPYELYVEDFSYFNKLGLGMVVHVYGDGTSEKMVDAIEEVRRRNGDNGVPFQFSHSFMTTTDQIKRLARIPDVSMDFITLAYPHPGVTGNFQPSIGEARYQQWLKARSAAEAGIPFGFGSDWPSSILPVPNGFLEMQAFATRRNPADPDSGTLNEDEAITLQQAVHAYTMGGAHCLGFDFPKKVGSIEKGKLADFIVLDRHIFEIPLQTLKDTLVVKTVVGGRVVFDRDAAEARLDLTKIDITNDDLQNAVDAAELNLLIEEDIPAVGCGCLGGADAHDVAPGSRGAPSEVNDAFAKLREKGYDFVRPARSVYWKNTDSDYWIQWTHDKDEVAVLWAYDPEAKQAVEVLRVREK